MAATLDRVRISASELRNLLAAGESAGSRGAVKEMREPRQRKDNRRPDIEIYKPGLSRLRNKSKLDFSGTGIDHTEGLQSEKENDIDSVNGISPSAASGVEVQEENDMEHDGLLFPTSEILDRKSTKRAKKPDRLIYQPGRRLQAVVKESIGDMTEDIVGKTEQMKIVNEEGLDNAVKSHKFPLEEGNKATKNDKYKRSEREKNNKTGEEKLIYQDKERRSTSLARLNGIPIQTSEGLAHELVAPVLLEAIIAVKKVF
ncbi:unnamed protein product [Staurois parvus]|uniref:Uncharacterized protein n=1 Tax=Staurois parvus TaxID=386267 RepID=A0ABN9BV95_9NEOB|nr:unnamed protein product [Staurois parvus]